MALAAKMHAARFNDQDLPLITANIYVLCSDGDLQEGVSAESAALAGHLGLGNLIAIYDSNQITIAGDARLSMSENVGQRFEAYGWHVQHCNGHDHDQIVQSIKAARAEGGKPSLIAKTTIDKSSPNKQGTSDVHGSPLGDEELAATKEALGWEHSERHVPDEVREVFANRKAESIEEYDHWQELFRQWQSAQPESKNLEPTMGTSYGEDQLLEELIPAVADKLDATRSLSGLVIQQAAMLLPGLVGGAADLEPSTKTLIKNAPSIVPASLDSQVLPILPSLDGTSTLESVSMRWVRSSMVLFGGFQVFGSTFWFFLTTCDLRCA